MADVTSGSTITVPTGERTLDLNGHTITRTGAAGNDNSGLAMTVNNGVNLTVTGPGKITGGKGFHGGGIHVEGNSSLVLDNCEISGNTGHYGGGLYLKNGTITLKNGTVVKENSASDGFGGSGIYAEGSGTLIMDGCTFTQNAIQNNNQYAVFLCGNANIKVSGAPIINNNTYGSAQHNLYMFQAGDQHSYVLINGSLTDGAKIAVGQTTGPGVFTIGWKDNMGIADPSKYFTSDNTDYIVFMNKDGEIEIGNNIVPDVSAEGFEGDYDGEAHGISVYVPDGAAVKYGTQEDSYTLTENPTYTDAGTYTVYYTVSMSGYTSVYGSAEVKIDPINVTVTITGNNNTVDYDGKAHSANGYEATASSELYDVTNDFTYHGRAEAVRTDAGTTNMGLTAANFENLNSNFANVTFEVTDGYIMVEPISVTVRITGRNNTSSYNGEAHTVSGYFVSSDNELYDIDSCMSFAGEAIAAQTDAGTAYMGLSEEQFSNVSPNFTDVEFIVTDGYQRIIPSDAKVTTAPSARTKTVYSGSDQELVIAGEAHGGTLLYALGDDEDTPPYNDTYSEDIPVASEIGNYYVWYMVEADSSHNSLEPACIKVTISESDWVVVTGRIYEDGQSAAVSGATVSLMTGSTVIDESYSDVDGRYQFTVPVGVYNIVIRNEDTTVTDMVDIRESALYDIVLPAAETNSLLSADAADKSIVVGGLDREAVYVRTAERIPAGKNVTVRMTVSAEAEDETKATEEMHEFAQDKNLEYYDLRIEKTVDSVTSAISKTENVLEIVIPCSFTEKRELSVYNYNNGLGIQTLDESGSREAGTYRVDKESGLVYIYTNSISTYAVGYKPYFSVKSEVMLGSFEGNVSVRLTKDSTGEVFELNDVPVDNISFAGIPKGTYTMDISWTDGAENTLTLPFTIN